MVLPECSICNLTYTSYATSRVPKILNCGHTFCFECIKQMYTEINVSITCPTCRGTTVLGTFPTQTNVASNFLALEIMESLQKNLTKERERTGEMKCMHHPTEVSKFMCTDDSCEEFWKEICGDCLRMGPHFRHQNTSLGFFEAELLREKLLKVKEIKKMQISSGKAKRARAIKSIENFSLCGNEFVRRKQQIDDHYDEIMATMEKRRDEDIENLEEKFQEKLSLSRKMTIKLEEKVVAFQDELTTMQDALEGTDDELLERKDELIEICRKTQDSVNKRDDMVPDVFDLRLRMPKFHYTKLEIKMD